MPRWLFAVLFVTGCSFGLRGPKDERPRTREPDCTSKKGLVILDTVAGSVFATAAAITLATSEPAWALLPAAFAAAYFGAALSGNQKVNACREAQTEFWVESEKRQQIDLTGVRENAPELEPDETVAKAPPPAAQAPPAKAAAQSPPAKAAAPTPQQADKDDEWGHFWREVTP